MPIEEARESPAESPETSHHDGGDRQLLERFVARRDEVAFAELVRRHSGIVWGVCRRVLGCEQDAEDAFQAAFLVLARKAATIRKGESVGSWLYAVAYRIAMVARKHQARRMKTELQVSRSVAAAPPLDESGYRELQRLLDEELQRLAQKYRAPFVLCCLQGLTRAEAASELGWRQGTVSGRLARARELLQKRLTRRGVSLAGVLAISALAPSAATAAPPALVAAATEGTLAVLAGKSAALSPSAVVLAETVLKGMTAVKLLSGLALSLTLALGAVAALQLQPGAANPEPGPPIAFEAHTFRQPPTPLVTPTDERIMTVALSPDERRLVTAGAFPPLPGQLTIWDVPTGKPLATVRGIPAIRSVAFAPDGRTLACGDFQGMVRVRDGFTGKELAAVKAHDLGVNAVEYAPDGQAIVSAGLDRLVKLWDAKTLQERGVFRGHMGEVLSVAFFKHGRGFVTGSRDGTAKVWDIASGAATQTLQCGQRVIEAVAVARDDKTIATAGWDGSFKLWDARTGQWQAKLHAPGRAAMSVSISPDGKTLAGGLDDGSIQRWNIETRKSLPSLPRQHALAVRALAFTADSKTLWTGSEDCTARQWDLVLDTPVATLTTKLGNYPLTALAYAPDGKTIAMATGDTVMLCDASNGALLHRLAGHTGEVRCLAFAPDGSLASGGEDKTVLVWDAAAGKQQRRLAGHAGAVTALAFAPDGGTLRSAGDDWAVKVWDAADGREVATFMGHKESVQALAFSPDGRSLASAGHDAIKIWDLATGAERATLHGHTGAVTALAFARDGTLASAGRDTTIKLWKRLQQGAEPVTLRGHRSAVHALAFSPGGSTLVSGSPHDNMLMVWDPAAGVARQVLPDWQRGALLSYGNHVGVALAFHPQGEQLLSGNLRGVVVRWQGNPPPPAPPAELLPERFYQDFRGARRPRSPLRIEGEGAEAVSKPEQAGLRVTLPNGFNKPGVWVRPHVLVSGDFDVIARYELLSVEPPSSGAGVGVVLLAVSPGSQKMAKLCRLLRLEGDRYLADITDQAHRPAKITAKTVPTQVREGRLRLVREGSIIRYLVDDAPGQGFREIHRDEFGARDVEEFALVVSGHGSTTAVDARLLDLRIRSGRFTKPPQVAGAGAPVHPGQPIPDPDGANAAADLDQPDPDQETDAASAGLGRRRWLWAGVILFILFAGIGLVKTAIRRARPSPGTAAPETPAAAATLQPGAAAPLVRVTCPGCGQALKALATLAGKAAKCPHCGQPVRLPENAPTTNTAAPGNARTTTSTRKRIAALAIVALLLGAAGYFLLAPPSRPALLNVTLGIAPVAGVEESGFHGEEFDGLKRPFRWSDGNARLVIPLDRAKPPQALWLHLNISRPPRVPPVTLQIVANGQDLLNEVTDGEWEKTLDLSAMDLGEELTLDIICNVFVPQAVPAMKSNDSRPLGVRVMGVKLLGPAEED